MNIDDFKVFIEKIDLYGTVSYIHCFASSVVKEDKDHSKTLYSHKGVFNYL